MFFLSCCLSTFFFNSYVNICYTERKKLFHPYSSSALWWIYQAIAAVPTFTAPCLELIDSCNTDCNSSCVFRCFPESGVSRKWTSSSVSHGGRFQGGSARQTLGSHGGRSQRGDSEGPTPVQRGQHRPTSATAAPQPETLEHEIPEEARSLPCCGQSLASADGRAPCCAGTASASIPTPSSAERGRLQPGENGQHGTVNAAAG